MSAEGAVHTEAEGKRRSKRWRLEFLSVQVGQTFGQLTVVGFRREGRKLRVLCRCSCGASALVAQTCHLLQGHRRSCPACAKGAHSRASAARARDLQHAEALLAQGQRAAARAWLDALPVIAAASVEERARMRGKLRSLYPLAPAQAGPPPPPAARRALPPP